MSYRLPTLIASPSGEDDGMPLYDVAAHYPGDGPTLHTTVVADDEALALYFAACEWGISDYAFRTRN